MSDYSKLTKKELLYTLIARDVMLKDCRERFELHKNTDAKTIQDQSDLIEELKAKLAESEKSEETYKSMFEIGVENNYSLLKEIEQLKQQLAEKDEKIKKLKSENHALMSDNAYQEADLFELTCFKEKADQDKISFCIEQLEKVKEYADIDFRKNCYINAVELDKFIDNQIKQLKETT